MGFLMQLDDRLERYSRRGQELAEELRVRWFMLDSQQKQALVLAGLYLGYTLMDLGGALLKSRLTGATE